MSSDLARWYHSMTFTYASEWDDSIRVVGKYLMLDPDIYDLTDGNIVFKSDKVEIRNGVLQIKGLKHGTVNTSRVM